MAKIAIDAGHGRYTPGKRCPYKLDKNETREWVLNDRVADWVETFLEMAGHEVIRIDNPTGETDVSLSARTTKANLQSIECYVSIHHNAGADLTSAGGTVVYRYPGTTGKTVELQEAVYKRAVEYGDLPGNRWDGTQEANFQVLRETRMSAVLIECGFMDSTTDIKYILDPAWSKKMARGIAQGICDVYGGTIKEPVENKEDKLYRVQVGAYSKKANAEKMLESLKNAGYDAYIK